MQAQPAAVRPWTSQNPRQVEGSVKSVRHQSNQVADHVLSRAVPAYRVQPITLTRILVEAIPKSQTSHHSRLDVERRFPAAREWDEKAYFEDPVAGGESCH